MKIKTANIKKWIGAIAVFIPILIVISWSSQKKISPSGITNNNYTDSFKIINIIGFSSNFQSPRHAISLRKKVERLAIKNKGFLFINGQTNSKKIALTFDDAPEDEFTEIIIDILDNYNIKATFFCIGEQIVKYPQILTKIYSSDHIVANHSFTHVNFIDTNNTVIYSEISKTNNEIFSLINKYPKYFRPPYGGINQSILNKITDQNMIGVYWSLDSYDWLETKQFVSKSINKYTRNDEIILLHCNKNTAENLPSIIENLQSKGYEIIRLDKLIGVPAYQNTIITEYTTSDY